MFTSPCSDVISGIEKRTAIAFAMADSLAARSTPSVHLSSKPTPGQLIQAQTDSIEAQKNVAEITATLGNIVKSAQSHLDEHEALGAKLLRLADHIETGARLHGDEPHELSVFAKRVAKAVQNGFDARSTIRSIRQSVEDAAAERKRFSSAWLKRTDLAQRTAAASIASRVLRHHIGTERKVKAADLRLEKLKHESNALGIRAQRPVRKVSK